MNTFDRYNIAIKGLEAGLHLFDFKMDSSFFEAFEESDIVGGHLDVRVELEKGIKDMLLNFTIEGEAILGCDRCLEELVAPIDYKGALEVKIVEKGMGLDEEESYDGEVLWLEESYEEVNIAQYVYESVVLSLPYRRVHLEVENGGEGCNVDMLGRFKIVTQEEFDYMEEEKEMVSLGDNPEFEKLKEIAQKEEE